VLVSEVMLQQTQVSRVLAPWSGFMETFATPTACADAPLSSVLRLWAGLGYHRRAKALHDAARMIRDEFNGEVPREIAQLRRLPGVGEYTANAVASFAFKQRVAVVDTNVARVLARALANRSLSPPETRDMSQRLLGRAESSAFNQAMLDLGAQFCRSAPLCASCPVAGICRWNKEGGTDPAPHSAGVSRPQSRFEGSDRQLRGRVLAELRASALSTDSLLARIEDSESARLRTVLDGLVSDGLVERRGPRVYLAGSEVFLDG
jgi:A/G-specific adenine glycosylase